MSENGSGWYRFSAANEEARYGWCETDEIVAAAEGWLNREREINLFAAEYLGYTDDTEYAEGRKLVDYEGLLVTADSDIRDFEINLEEIRVNAMDIEEIDLGW